jgi:hypothetical protein
MEAIVFDCEIEREIPESEEQERMPGIDYCSGWDDFEHMGIACITAVDTFSGRPHVFLQDNLSDFRRLLKSRELSVSFNGMNFDIPLLLANGIHVDKESHFDLASAIWSSAGIPPGEHPKGLGLNAICIRNGIEGKSGDGKEAPRWFQTGKIGRLIDYCLGDTYATAALFRRIMDTGGIKDPRPHTQWSRVNGWIPVGLPM